MVVINRVLAMRRSPYTDVRNCLTFLPAAVMLIWVPVVAMMRLV
jgi:hypothetical protein